VSAITTHVLDLSRGCPAAGIPVILQREADGDWKLIGSGVTDADGRIADLLPSNSLEPGVYRLLFNTGKYFAARNRSHFQN
jgi:5-hydroxyisourate hydrolase